jgi:hypothetical protein
MRGLSFEKTPDTRNMRPELRDWRTRLTGWSPEAVERSPHRGERRYRAGMRTAASLAFFFLFGCGAATGIPVGESARDASTRDTSVAMDVTTPPADTGSDATDADALAPPMDADVDVSGETVVCAFRSVGTVGISQVNCGAGFTCVAEQGCEPTGATGLPPASACGAIACATECECLSESFCNCASP